MSKLMTTLALYTLLVSTGTALLVGALAVASASDAPAVTAEVEPAIRLARANLEETAPQAPTSVKGWRTLRDLIPLYPIYRHAGSWPRYA